MKKKIFYFSGTGNSLFIARKLQEQLDEAEIIPIIKALRYDNKEINAETVMAISGFPPENIG